MAIKWGSFEKQLYNFFKSKGLSDEGIYGLFGNLYGESAMNPKNLQDTSNKKLGLTDEAYTAAVDSGSYTNFVHDSAGFGIAQWTFWSRKQGLLEFCRKAGKSIGDGMTQAEYLYKELSENYKAVLTVLKTAASIRAASDAVLLKFEQPADQSSTVQELRAGYGLEYQKAHKAAQGGQVGAESSGGGKNMISNCGHDENNKYTGGAAGDQTGGEWALIAWYNRPWKCVLRHPDAAIRQKIAQLATAAAKNDLVGYDQGQRYTFWEHLKASNYDPAKITIKCEADCSSGVAAIVKAVGYLTGDAKLQAVSIYCYTGNLRAALKAAGFTVLTESKYLTGPDYLLAGDILLNDDHHTATNVTDGSKATTGGSSSGGSAGGSAGGSTGGALSKAVKFEGQTTTELNVRSWAGTENSLCSFSPLKEGERISICDEVKAANGATWYYIKNAAGKYGFVSAAYVKKITSTGSAASAASFAPGDKVKVTGTIYGNGNGTGGSLKKNGEVMYVTELVSASAYRYYIGVAGKKGGARQGWAEPSALKKV